MLSLRNTWQDNFDEIVQTGDTSAVKLRNRETEFYKMIGVDYRICIYGFDHYSFWDYVAAYFKSGVIMGFDYSVEDLKKFGIDNIHLVDGEWDWRKYRETSYIVVRVKVKDDLL